MRRRAVGEAREVAACATARARARPGAVGARRTLALEGCHGQQDGVHPVERAKRPAHGLGGLEKDREDLGSVQLIRVKGARLQGGKRACVRARDWTGKVGDGALHGRARTPRPSVHAADDGLLHAWEWRLPLRSCGARARGDARARELRRARLTLIRWRSQPSSGVLAARSSATRCGSASSRFSTMSRHLCAASDCSASASSRRARYSTTTSTPALSSSAATSALAASSSRSSTSRSVSVSSESRSITSAQMSLFSCARRPRTVSSAPVPTNAGISAGNVARAWSFLSSAKSSISELRKRLGSAANLARIRTFSVTRFSSESTSFLVDASSSAPASSPASSAAARRRATSSRVARACSA